MATRKRKAKAPKASEVKPVTLGPAVDVTAVKKAPKRKQVAALPEGSCLAGPAWGEQI